MINNLKDSQGRYKTMALFVETLDPRVAANGYEPVFTLKDHDLENGTPSLKRLYLESMDPSEFTFAEEVFGTYLHWQKLVECTWFQPYLEQWRKELELKLQSEAIKKMREQARSGNVQAAKWLGDKKWKVSEESKKVGRPKKAVTVEKSEEDYEDDARRLGLRSINGGKND